MTSCDYCGKIYKRDSSLQKHKIPCKVLYLERAKRISIIDNITLALTQEEENNMFTLKQVNLILSEVILQNKKMQEELNAIKKFIYKTKMKINIIDWLSIHVTPSYSFNVFVDDNFIVNQSHIEYIKDNNFFETIDLILYDMIKMEKEKNSILPIFCYTEKENVFYIYNGEIWKEITYTEMFKFMNIIHNKLMIAFKQWRIDNDYKIQNDNLYYNINHKLTMKIMGIDFNKDISFNKMRISLFSKLKTEIKLIVEYEFI